LLNLPQPLLYLFAQILVVCLVMLICVCVDDAGN